MNAISKQVRLYRTMLEEQGISRKDIAGLLRRVRKLMRMLGGGYTTREEASKPMFGNKNPEGLPPGLQTNH